MASAKMMSMGTLVVFGFLKGFQPIAVFGSGAAIFATGIMSLFTRDDEEMIEIGAAALRACGLSFFFFGFYTVYFFLFLVMGRAKEGLFLGACRQGICFIPAIWLLPMRWGLKGGICAQPAADVMAAMIAGFMALSLHRRLKACLHND